MDAPQISRTPLHPLIEKRAPHHGARSLFCFSSRQLSPARRKEANFCREIQHNSIRSKQTRRPLVHNDRLVLAIRSKAKERKKPSWRKQGSESEQRQPTLPEQLAQGGLDTRDGDELNARETGGIERLHVLRREEETAEAQFHGLGNHARHGTVRVRAPRNCAR